MPQTGDQEVGKPVFGHSSEAGQKENKSCKRNLIYSRVYKQILAKGKTNEEARDGARLELLRLGFTCRTKRVSNFVA